MSRNPRKKAPSNTTSEGPPESQRDLSPSHSSAAALEWDPSADVGTQVPANTPVNRPDRTNAELSGLEQMVLAINYGYDLRSEVNSSRSNRMSRKDEKPSDGSDSNNSSYKTATETDPSDQVDIPQTENVSTSLSNSDWRNSGLTRSEIERMNKRKEGSTTRSSSVVWVEVIRQDGDSSTRNNMTTSASENNIEEETSRSSKKSVGVQVKSKTHSHPHRVKTDNRVNARSQFSDPRVSREPPPQEYHHYHEGNRVLPPPTNSEYCRHHCVPMQCHCYGMPVQGSRPKLHGQSHAVSKSCRTKVDCERDNNNTSSSSDLTPTCILIDKLINEDDSVMKNHGYAALEEHRHSLVRKMRKELQHLEQLNRMLLEKRRSSHLSSTPTTSNSSSNQSKEKYSSVPSHLEETVVKHTQILKSTKSVSNNKARENIPHDQKPQQRQQHGQQHGQQIKKREPVSYFLPFSSGQINRKNQTSRGKENNNDQRMSSKSQKIIFQNLNDNGQSDDYYDNLVSENEIDNIRMSLQQAFLEHCPNVLANVQQRENILNNLRLERECRAEIKREYFSTRNNNCLSPNESLNNALPPKEPRLMSSRQMKLLTEKKLKHLPEVREKMQKQRVEENKRTFRIMSQVFSKKLRQNVLKGDVNFVHTASLIRR